MWTEGLLDGAVAETLGRIVRRVDRAGDPLESAQAAGVGDVATGDRGRFCGDIRLA